MLTNDRASQMENGEGKDEKKHYCGGQFLPGFCHLYFHFSSFCLQTAAIFFFCVLSPSTCLEWRPAQTAACSYQGVITGNGELKTPPAGAAGGLMNYLL